MAPLGILTAIAGAIRVGGASWLKRLVGRARENNANVEIELMSSVSQEVCELWNGKSIVRSTGQPEVKQIIHLPAEEGDISPESFITMNPNTWSEGYKLKDRDSTVVDVSEDAGSAKTDDNHDSESLQPKDTARPIKYQDMPPNISLNIHGGSNPVELVMYAFFATMLQVIVLGWSGFLAYSSFAHRNKFTGLRASVGFPLQAAGTLLLTLSLVICASIIDNGSCERHWLREEESQMGTLAKDQSSKEKPFNRRDMQLYWIQKQHTAGDNSFNPYILYAEDLNDEIHESHRAEEKSQNDRDDASLKLKSTPRLLKFLRFLGQSQNKKQDPKPYTKTTIAVVLGILGFVAQFQGLRFSNWTCSMAQLIALGVATILRALVRRSMIKTPVAVPVNNDYILDNLTLAIIGKGPSGSKFASPEAFRSPGLSLAFGVTANPELRAITEPESKDQVQSKSEPSNRENLESVNSGSQPSINVQLSTEVEKKSDLAQQALNLRVRLGFITKWTGPRSQEAIILANSIDTALERLSPRLPAEFREKCAVVFRVDIYRTMPHAPPTSMPSSQEVELKIIKDGDKWKVNDAELEALLSLVSYSAWAAQNKKNREETDREKSSAHLDFSGHRTKEQSIENSRSTGWLRAKAPDSQIYNKIVGKSSTKLLSDLFWWTSGTERVPRKVGIVNPFSANRIFPNFTKSLSDDEEKCNKAERPALGFYVKDETLDKNCMVTIQRLMWRALTFLDIFWFSECSERKVFILHLFSTFIWATAPYLVSASQFHPTTVISSREGLSWSTVALFPLVDQDSGCVFTRFPLLKSDKIEALVQELQSIGLGTSEEIYRTLIPPLSHFKKLPNEAVADWCNERLIKLEVGLSWEDAFQGYVELLNAIQHREVQDRFANRAAAMIVEFLLRMSEDPKPLTFAREIKNLNWFNKQIRGFVKNKNVLKAILSLKDILARRWDLPKDDCASLILKKLGFEDLLDNPDSEFKGLLQEVLRTFDYAPERNGFSFPNETDVFGWTADYWSIFYGTFVGTLPRDNKSSYQTLDLAGQSVLHHIIDRIRKDSGSGLEYYVLALDGFSKYGLLRDSGLLAAKCNKQTPLHRAVRPGKIIKMRSLLEMRVDLNAADFSGRTALCLAAHHGDFEVVKMLCEQKGIGLDRTDRGGRNALHYAVLNQKEEAASTLIKHGININAEDNEGRPPLWYAASNGMIGVVESLLKNDGINRKSWGDRKWQFLEQAAEQAGHKEIAEMIRQQSI